MQTKTKRVVGLTGGAVIIAVIAVLITLGIQKLQFKSSTPPPVETVQTPPPAPAVPQGPPMAQVTGVKPHYVNVTTSAKKCYPTQSTTYVQQPVYQSGAGSSGNVAGTLVGGALGGLAGSAIHGSARTAAILAGAGLGAYAGHQVQANRQQPQVSYTTVPKTTSSTKCSTQTVNKQVQRGYEVTYWYNGTQGLILMDTPPASGTIPLPGYNPSMDGSTGYPQSTPSTYMPASSTTSQ